MKLGIGLIRSPCFLVILGLFFHGCFLIGVVKAGGVFLSEMAISLHTTSADLGLIIGFYIVGSLIPGMFLMQGQQGRPFSGLHAACAGRVR